MDAISNMSFTSSFFQNPHYSHIQEHLRPSTSICIFPCFFMIYQSCKTKQKIHSCHDLISNPRIFIIYSQVFVCSIFTSECNKITLNLIRFILKSLQFYFSSQNSTRVYVRLYNVISTQSEMLNKQEIFIF